MFDTAFHQTMPPAAYLYALPLELFEKHGVRRYGFHGTSFRFLTAQAAVVLKKPQTELNAVIAHLGMASASVFEIK